MHENRHGVGGRGSLGMPNMCMQATCSRWTVLSIESGLREEVALLEPWHAMGTCELGLKVVDDGFGSRRGIGEGVAVAACFCCEEARKVRVGLNGRGAVVDDFRGPPLKLWFLRVPL